MSLPSNTATPSSEAKAFGPYTVVRKIGDGGMGAVYEGKHTSLGKRVALKVLLPEMAANEEIAARFVREGQAAAKIRHPHVVDVYDVGATSSGAYLVMELLEGNDLGRMLETRGRLPAGEALSILLPVFSAVYAAHREGVIHRDLKPANIFLATDSIGRLHPKVVDFGISKIIEDPGGMVLTQSAAVLGTPYYMAPEQVQAVKNTTAQSDQYSLAVILFECVTGQRPFVADSLYELLLAITGLDAPAAWTVTNTVPRGLSDAIRKAMSRDPAGRFASVREFGRAVLPFADELTRTLWGAEFSDALRTPADQRPGTPAQLAMATLPISPPIAPAASGFGPPNLGTGLEFSSATAKRPATSSKKLAGMAGVIAVVALLGVVGVLVGMRGASSREVAPSSDPALLGPPVTHPDPTLPAPTGSVADLADTPVASASASATPTPPSAETVGGPTTTGHKPPATAKTTAPATPTPTGDQTGGGAIRGANSAWIVR